MVKWWKPIVLAALLGTLGWFVGYGLGNRPLVDYTLDMPSFWYFTETTQMPNYDPVMTFHVNLRNRGLTDTEVNVNVTVLNASVSTRKLGPFNASISLEGVPLTARSDNYGYLILYLKPIKNASSFEVSCSVTRKPDYSSFSAVVSTLFVEIKGQWPTTVKYINSNGFGYELQK